MDRNRRIVDILRLPLQSFTYAMLAGSGAPRNIQVFVGKVARELGEAGCVLRSGGEEGFEASAESNARQSEIFLPYKRFNRNDSPRFEQHKKSFDIAKDVTKSWLRINEFAKKCAARYVHAILGDNLDSPASLIICWSEDGAVTEEQTSSRSGHVKTAISVAERNGIPLLNLGRRDDIDLLISCLRPNGVQSSKAD